MLIDNILTKIYIYLYIYAFSLYKILEVSLYASQFSVFEAFENSICECGGFLQHVQIDNDKCFVSNPSKEHFQWNQRYLQFCGHYGYKLSRSLPRHPWSKVKVDKPFAFIEDNFITKTPLNRSKT